MTTQLSDKIIPAKEQRFIFPDYYSWEQFEAIEALIADTSSLRVTYLDGCVEFMTIGEEHELIKTVISFLLQLYFCEMEIEEEAREQGAGGRGDSSGGDSTPPEREPLIRSGGLRPMFRSASQQGEWVISPRSLPPSPCLFVHLMPSRTIDQDIPTIFYNEVSGCSQGVPIR